MGLHEVRGLRRAAADAHPESGAVDAAPAYYSPSVAGLRGPAVLALARVSKLLFVRLVFSSLRGGGLVLGSLRVRVTAPLKRVFQLPGTFLSKLLLHGHFFACAVNWGNIRVLEVH